MAYTVHNFEQGDVLYAEQLNEMDAQIAANEESIETSISSDMLAESYSANKTYSIGDYVIYNNELYTCIYEITAPEGWNSAHWRIANLGDGISDLGRQLSDTKSALDSAQDDIDVMYNLGSNLWNIQFANANITSRGVYVPLTSGVENASTEGYLSVEPATEYCMSFVPTEKYVTIYVYEYDSSKVFLSEITEFQAYSANPRNSTIITTSSSGHYLRFKAYRRNEPWRNIVPDEIQFEEGTTPTEYHPYGYKTSKLIPIDDTLISLQEQIDENPALTQRREVATNTNVLFPSIKGYLKNDGTFNTTTSGWQRSDYIPVEPDTFMYFHGINQYSYYGFFNNSKEWIGGRDIETPAISDNAYLISHKVPTGARFMIVSFEDADANTAWGNYLPVIPNGDIIYANTKTLRAYSEYPENPCDYSGLDVCTFRKGLCIGDSLTAGGFNYSSGTNPWADGNVYSYPSQFQKMTGIPMTNEGHSGLTTVQWWNTYGSGGASEIDFSGYDFAIIHLGVNDVSYNVPIADTQTAYQNIINALKSANTGIKIFVCTIIPAYAIDGITEYDSINTMIKSFTEQENVYCCDLTRYGHTYKNSQYAAGHLTAYGYWRFAKDLVAYIGYIMREKPAEFRFIQYIGTDMSY